MKETRSLSILGSGVVGTVVEKVFLKLGHGIVLAGAVTQTSLKQKYKCLNRFG